MAAKRGRDEEASSIPSAAKISKKSAEETSTEDGAPSASSSCSSSSAVKVKVPLGSGGRNAAVDAGASSLRGRLWGQASRSHGPSRRSIPTQAEVPRETGEAASSSSASAAAQESVPSASSSSSAAAHVAAATATDSSMTDPPSPSFSSSCASQRRQRAAAVTTAIPPPLLGLPPALAIRSETGNDVESSRPTGNDSLDASRAQGGSASGSGGGSSRRKRSPDDLALLCELPPREAEAVGLALEQWGRLRHRVKALEPTLRREGALVQEILDTGLRDENRRTLRKLTQSSASGDVEETIEQVGKAIGANRERLERILERNHGELVRLSTTAVSDLKEDVLREVDEVLARLKRALAAVRSELLGAKERSDMVAVRRTGRSFNDLKALVRRLDDERRLITRNSALAALLVTVCRRVLPVRQVDPAALRDIPPSCEGYRRIMDFYFFTDAGLYFFGDYPSGPNWFVRLKRNVAILLVQDDRGNVMYNHFAVSGEHRAPGAAPAPTGGLLRSTEAEDEHGRVFNRQHDAEFKLLSGLLTEAFTAHGIVNAAEKFAGTGVLWSRKPLCRSCIGAVKQVSEILPNLRLQVSVGSSVCACAAKCGPAASEGTPISSCAATSSGSTASTRPFVPIESGSDGSSGSASSCTSPFTLEVIRPVAASTVGSRVLEASAASSSCAVADHGDLRPTAEVQAL